MNGLILWAGACCALVASGCWSHIGEYCSGCATVEHTQIVVPPPAPGTRVEVVLVHGAFGFGPEWTPVVETLRHTPGLAFFAWTWPGLGIFSDLHRNAQVLAGELQALLDRLPPSVSELYVMAHSTGALLSNFAVRQLRVPPGRRVTVALLDPVLYPMLTLWPGLAERAAYPPVPPGVTITVYVAGVAPRPLRQAAARPALNPVTIADLPHKYVGNLGHNQMVAKIALPLLAALRGEGEGARSAN